MAIKSIVCLFGGAEHEVAGLDTALTLAKIHGARVRIVHVSSPSPSYAGFYGEAVMLSAAWIDAIEQENAKRLANARQHAEALAARHDIPLDPLDRPADRPWARFVAIEAQAGGALARQIRPSDLIVVGRRRGATNVSEDTVFGTALFSTWRPVLFVPPAGEGAPAGWRETACGLAWNGSLEAARALCNAMPLMERTQKVHVLIAHEPGRGADTTDESVLMDYLDAHGVPAELSLIDRGGKSAGEAVLSRARALGCDFLVMGAYGHSVFREMLLGGITAYMLEEAEMPLAMCH